MSLLTQIKEANSINAFGDGDELPSATRRH